MLSICLLKTVPVVEGNQAGSTDAQHYYTPKTFQPQSTGSMGQPLDGASVRGQGGFLVQALNQGTESAINSPSYFQHVINSFKVQLPLPKIG